ncbi:unnamed protein product [Spirodela intermedia]|uniref:Uncharacterized protein n=1 Tax=Spirodela intermedia TaxID=51605 RepID=A0A7I8K035_SPIIN|nr:unnamed protein product [Spirodela intermedia]
MAYGAAADGGRRKSTSSRRPRRGQVKVKILGMLFKSVVAVASVHARRGGAKFSGLLRPQKMKNPA